MGLQPELYNALRADFDPSYIQPIPAVAVDAPLPATEPDVDNDPGTPGAGPSSEDQDDDTSVDSPGKKVHVLKRCATRKND